MSDDARPNGLVQRAADMALVGASTTIDQGGARLASMVVLLHVAGQPEGEPGAAVAAKGVGGDRELFELLVGNAAIVAGRLGILFEVPE